MSGYFDRLEDELRAAVPLAAARPRVRIRRPAFGAVAAALGVGVTIAVVVVAVALLGHARPTAATRTAPGRPASRTVRAKAAGHRASAPLAEPAVQASSRAVLLAEFAVLRRPQTAADRAWTPPHVAGERLVPSLTRLAETLIDRERVFFTVGRYPGAPRGWSWRLEAYFVAPDGHATAITGGGTFSSLSHDGATVDFAPVSVAPPTRDGATIWVSVVPDVIRHVRWTFSPRYGCRAGGVCPSGSPVTYTIPTHSNLATTWVRQRGDCAAPGCVGPTAVTWMGPRGISGYTLSMSSGSVAPVLRGDAIGGARFGQPAAAAITTVTRLLGPPSHPYAASSSCPVDHDAGWSSPRVTGLLWLFFTRGHLVGYQYGKGNRGRGKTLSTSQGMTVGQPLSVARRLYGSALQLSAAQGGSWRVRTSTGALSGYDEAAPGHGVTNIDNRVESIDAGTVGCPAVTP